MEPILAESTRKHGVDDEATLHAYRNAVAYEVIREDFTMFIGPDHAGRFVEVGAVESCDGEVVIVHSMPARDMYLKHVR